MDDFALSTGCPLLQWCCNQLATHTIVNIMIASILTGKASVLLGSFKLAANHHIGTNKATRQGGDRSNVQISEGTFLHTALGSRISMLCLLSTGRDRAHKSPESEMFRDDGVSWSSTAVLAGQRLCRALNISRTRRIISMPESVTIGNDHRLTNPLYHNVCFFDWIVWWCMQTFCAISNTELYGMR